VCTVSVYKFPIFLDCLLGLQPVLYCMCECLISQERAKHFYLDGVNKLPGIEQNWALACTMLSCDQRPRAQPRPLCTSAFSCPTVVCDHYGRGQHVCFALGLIEPQSLLFFHFPRMIGLSQVGRTRNEGISHRIRSHCFNKVLTMVDESSETGEKNVTCISFNHMIHFSTEAFNNCNIFRFIIL
jgi:hypothetical protein